VWGKQSKTFSIPKEDFRFFNVNGDYIKAENLPTGEVFAYTKKGDDIYSDALTNIKEEFGLVLHRFDFEDRDLIQLPNNKTIAVGNKIEEGLSRRCHVENILAEDDKERFPIYNCSPTYFFTLSASKTAGTQIIINQKRYRLSDELQVGKTIRMFTLDNLNDNVGYSINLGELGCCSKGLYEIIVDVPNDRTARRCKFLLLNNFQYSFEEGPYYFKTRGTISFDNADSIIPISEILTKVPKEPKYNFEISPCKRDLEFEYTLDSKPIKLLTTIPTFEWSMDNVIWNVEKVPEIWHGDLPTKLFVICPEKTLTLVMDVSNDYYEESEHDEPDVGRLEFSSRSQNDIVECDITRIHSWLGRDTVKKTISLELEETVEIPFLEVITRSVVASKYLEGDYDNSLLKGEINIIGYSDYFADIYLEDELIVCKQPIINEKFVVEADVRSGVYKVVIFESEPDTSGFGNGALQQIDTFETKLLNPKDLAGISFQIERIIKLQKENAFVREFKRSYSVHNIKRNSDIGSCTYVGELREHTESDLRLLKTQQVIIEFYNANKLNQIYMWLYDEEYDELQELLYNNVLNHLCKEEGKSLSKAEAYRRYESIYDQDYYYEISFIDD
jgi:hypothetical protein